MELQSLAETNNRMQQLLANIKMEHHYAILQAVLNQTTWGFSDFFAKQDAVCITFDWLQGWEP